MPNGYWPPNQYKSVATLIPHDAGLTLTQTLPLRKALKRVTMWHIYSGLVNLYNERPEFQLPVTGGIIVLKINVMDKKHILERRGIFK